MDLALFARRVHDRRVELGLSVAEAARRYGHARRNVADYEAGTTRPHPDHVRQLAQALGVPANLFLQPLGYDLDPESAAAAAPDARIVALITRLRRLRQDVNQALAEAEALAA